MFPSHCSAEFWLHVLDFTQQLTTEVGTKLLLDSQGAIFAQEKADGSMVTASDQWADREIRHAIKATFPEHGFITEEDQQNFGAQTWSWVVDPIDGTTNFARGIPLWGISIALLYQGLPVFGYIYFPAVQQAFHGFWLGENPQTGAFLNGQPLKPSPPSLGPNQIFSACTRSLPYLIHPFPAKLRSLGVAAYNLLCPAAGIMVGAVEATPKAWDIAAVWVIVQAAGVVWVPLNGTAPFPLKAGTDYEKMPFPTLVVSRKEWVEVFVPLLGR